MIALATNVAWGSQPQIKVSFYYEKTRDGADMKYRTQTIISPITGASYFDYNIKQKISMDGTQKEDTLLKDNSPSQWSNSITYTSPWYTISNKTSGTTPVTFTLYSNSGRSNLTASYSMEVDPAYPTANQSLNAKTETSIIMNWSSDSVIDYAWYSIDNGALWFNANITEGKSGTYTISNLSANTTYQIITRLSRKDNHLSTDTGALSVTTYNYPYCTSMPNFIIGNRLTLSLYNPLNRSMTVKLIGNDNSIVDTWTGSGTTIIGYDAVTTVNNLYASIPNSKNGTYKVSVIYGSSTITKTGGTYSINEVACKPSITSGAYQDTNSTVTAITLNNQNIVRNQSTVRYTASGLTVKNSATIASCSVTINANTYNLTVSGTSATGGNAIIDSASNLTATFTLTDSRGLTATKDITITMLDWVLPTAIITLQRHNNFYSETDINVDALYSSIDNKNTITIQYCYKKITQSTYSSYYSLQDNVTTVDTFDNLYEWDIKFKITDLFGTTYYNLVLPKGMPIIYFDRLKGSTGLNCFPKYENSLEIDGSENTRYCGRAIASAVNVSSLTFTTITFDTFNLKSERTIIEQNNIIKVLKDGIYKISFNARWADISSGSNNCCVGVSINGSTTDNPEQTIWQTNSKRLTANGTILRQLNANDTIQPLLYTENATTLNEIIMWVESLNIEGGD